MRCLNCDPQSYPHLPETSTHRLWQSWDLAVETFLTNFTMNKNLPQIIHLSQEKSIASVFFNDHLSSFEIWLDFGDMIDRPPSAPFMFSDNCSLIDYDSNFKYFILDNA